MMNKVKYILGVMMLALLSQSAFAQEEEEKKGYDPNRLFIGGSLGLGMGFGSNTNNFFIGLYPQVGYSFTDRLDAGVVVNGSYNLSKTDYGAYKDKYQFISYGTGAFVRGYLFGGLFAQVQPEINWMRIKFSRTGEPDTKESAYAGSFLVGGGFGSRVIGRSGFFTTIMFDVLNEPNSPYRSYGNVIPIIQAGFTFYLGQKKQDKYMNANPGM